MDYKVEANHISKKFKDKTVLYETSLKIRRGSICGLIGRNGSGKTVLMKIICGFIHSDTGEILVEGKKIGKDIDFPEDTGIIIENPNFSPYQSGYGNLANLASIQKKIGKKEIRCAMEQVGLDPEDRKWVSKYSLGMKQRLAIAQAIMENQDLLILDEPMNGLDQQGVEDMRSLFLELKNQGKTILLSSHNPIDIEILCDSIYMMDNGKMTQEL